MQGAAMQLALSTRVQMASFTTTFPDSTCNCGENELEVKECTTATLLSFIRL